MLNTLQQCHTDQNYFNRKKISAKLRRNYEFDLESVFKDDKQCVVMAKSWLERDGFYGNQNQQI